MDDCTLLLAAYWCPRPRLSYLRGGSVIACMLLYKEVVRRKTRLRLDLCLAAMPECRV